MAGWRERTVQAAFVVAIASTGALMYELLAPVQRLEPPVAAPAEWVTKPYHQNVGRHMCRADTGEYLGKIEWVGYSNSDKTSVYSTTIIGPARRHEDGALTYPVRYVTVPVAAVFVTDGKCADGRP